VIYLNKYIGYIKKYILMIVLNHIIIWFFVERQGIGRHELRFFDNFLFNSFILTMAVMGFWIPDIVSRLINFFKSRKAQSEPPA